MLNMSILKVLKRKNLKNKRVIITFFICFVSMLYVFKKKNDESPTPYKIVEVEKVQLSSISNTISLIGEVKAKKSALIVSKTSGFLKTNIHPGEIVEKGTLIATIENSDIEENYKLSEEAVKISKNQYQRLLHLKNGNVSSQKDLENSLISFIEAQKALSLARNEYEKTRFIAPFKGIMSPFKIFDGSFVEQGHTIGFFYDPSEMIITFDLSENVLKQIKNNPKVSIEGTLYDIPHFQNCIIDPITHLTSAHIHFKGSHIIGSLINIELIAETHENVITIPFDAVFLKEGKAHVYIVKDEKAHLLPIELGLRSKERVEILSGLEINQSVIKTNTERLYPGVSVKIYEPEK
jgi:membrane fusion protein (multidrug efflux system)